ncbi:MAG: DUF924 family protein [Pseudomonadota bacterium]
MTRPEDVLEFWLDECKPEDWFRADPDFDLKITEIFRPAWERAMEGSLSLWLTYPSGALAYIILTDQFSRNMFRGTSKAFASDPLALAVSKSSIAKGWDQRIDEPARHFFYMPLMHSETLVDQDRCVRLMATRMTDNENSILHAKAHREVIRLYGRFPTRNEALGRSSTTKEIHYLENGSYGAVVRELSSVTA